MPNQLNNARRVIFHRGTIPFSQLQFEFDKNANSDSVVVKIILFRRVGLATIGVCVFCAAASVAALFILQEKCTHNVEGGVLNGEVHGNKRSQ